MERRHCAVEGLVSIAGTFSRSYAGKRVLVTGHTGFKGSWLCEWLLALGAEVAGFALPPETEPALFDQLQLARRMVHQIGDIRKAGTIARVVRDARPDYIFHLAAQPLVRLSYDKPVETFDTNVMGTANLLEAAQALDAPCAVVCITTDKVYENLEAGRAFSEDDKLGGHDPYSASKAAAEIVIESYRKSFFSRPGSKIALASARAGNVLGGGDWAADRILPDAMRALSEGREIPVRNPRSTRPWQHVLEPLSGYLLLGSKLPAAPPIANPAATAFNFGPDDESNRTVEQLVEEVLKHRPGKWRDTSDPTAPHEAKLLHLSTERARSILGWRPVWNFEQTIRETVAWYASSLADKAQLTREQILRYTRNAAGATLVWAASKS
jgi:CDP-glucose 4,6-dehydratase